MLTVTIASGKGGTCKTSLTAALAVMATKEAKRVCIIDLNADQASLSKWWETRGKPRNPYLHDITGTKLATDLKAIAVADFKFVLIDTPPDEMRVIEGAVAVADVVVIPVRASAMDIDGARAIVDICQRRRKPFAFLLAAVDTRAAFKPLNKEALADLGKLGPVLTAQFPNRPAYVEAMAEGKTGHEIDATLAREIERIWTEVKEVRRG